jgi:ParB/RepB/Spo0J family partition protein
MSEQVQRIPLTQLLPWHNGGKGQPRQHFDEKALRELADSMMTGGFVGSIQVRPFPGRPGFYEILAGHRRTKAAALAHLAEIPATVNDLDDTAARFFVLQDNLQREDFLPWEEGAVYAELVAGGLAVAAVAGRVGKSPSFVAGRIAVHNCAGEKCRELYLRKELTLEALQLCSALPDRDLAPVRCPACKAVVGEQFDTCPACAADLSALTRYPFGNPQYAAALACRGLVNGAARDKIERVKEAYGLSDTPVQTSLGFTDRQISDDAIKVRSALERKLGEVGAMSDWFLKNLDCLAEFDDGQRAAVVQQCEVAERLFGRIKAAARPEPATLAMAL